MADFADFCKVHAARPSECLITMMTFRTDEPSACGVVELDDRGVVVGFYEKVPSPPSNLANGAVYILSNTFIQELKELNDENAIRDFSLDVLPKFMGRIFTYETKEDFADIGTLAAYKKYLNVDLRF